MADEQQHPEESLAEAVAAVTAVTVVPADEADATESRDPDACMYCRGALILPRCEEWVCDTCHYESMTVAARIEQVEREVEAMAAQGHGDLSLYLARVHAAVDTAVTLAQSRDERLVRQYAQGLLDGLRIGAKLEVKPFPVAAFKEYAKTARIWGD